MTLSIGGGLGEEYMSAPRIQAGDNEKGSGSFIASLLDVLGIHRQVAKEPKDKKGQPPAGDSVPLEKQSTKKQMGNNASPTGMDASGTKGAPAFTPMMGASTSLPAAAPPPPGLTVLDDATRAFTPQASKFGLSLPRTLR